LPVSAAAAAAAAAAADVDDDDDDDDDLPSACRGTGFCPSQNATVAHASTRAHSTCACAACGTLYPRCDMIDRTGDGT
jgi:hypothetical protein